MERRAAVRRLMTCVALAVLLAAVSSLAWGVEIVETYRSPGGPSLALSVDPGDGSCWVFPGGFSSYCLRHLDAQGNLLQELPSDHSSSVLSVNTADGSVWIALYDQVLHLARDGQELWRGDHAARSVSVNPTDGSVWMNVVDLATSESTLVLLASDGHELRRIPNLGHATLLVASPLDASCWVFYTREQDNWAGLKHFGSDGTVLGQWEGLGATALGLNAGDGSVWSGDQTQLCHISAGNAILWQSTDYAGALSLAVNAADGSCWYRSWSDVQHPTQGALFLVQLGADGTPLQTLDLDLYASSYALAVNPVDGSLWAPAGYGTVHLASDGIVLSEDRGVVRPFVITLSASDGSYWISGLQDQLNPDSNPWVARYDVLGRRLWKHEGSSVYNSLSPDSTDGSVWLADYEQITHFAADGTPLPFTTTYGLYGPRSVALDPDGSLWICDTATLNHVDPAGVVLQSIALEGQAYDARLAPDGSLWVKEFYEDSLWRVLHVARNGSWSPIAGLFARQSTQFDIAIDPRDGSVWVCDTGRYDDLAFPTRITHLSPTGTVLWQGGTDYDGMLVCVDPSNGDCWVFGLNSIHVLASTGEERGSRELSFWPWSVRADPATGTMWLLGGYSEFRKYTTHGPFSDLPLTSWAAPAVSLCASADVVNGYWDGAYHPEWAVTRAQMAAFIGRALAHGDTHVPPGPAAPTFPDVPPDSWAYDYVEYAAQQRIVSGYPDGSYGPEVPVDRGQMSAFIARAMAPLSERPDLPGYTPPTTASFADVPTNHWAFKEVEYIRKHYVARGYWDGLYHPEYVCTRDQMAVFIARTFQLFR